MQNSSLLFAGRRMDNRAQERPGGLHQKGVRFFVEDEDEFGLDDMLQARSCQNCNHSRQSLLGAQLHPWCAHMLMTVTFASVLSH